MTLCGVHDNMHVHTTVAHTCDYPLYLHRHKSVTVVSAQTWYESNCVADRRVIVHLFEWKWSDVALECERFLSPRGFCGVQVSPPADHLRLVEGSSSTPEPWWQRYQPVGYNLDSRSGSEAEFFDMVTRCNAVDVRVFVDAVINHMAGLGQSGTGYGGSEFTSDIDNPYFPAAGFDPDDFNDCSNCGSCCCIDDTTNHTEVRDCPLVNLIDINPAVPHALGILQGYLNKMIDGGVAGFRVDAAANMYPDDIEGILMGLNDLPTSHGFPAGAKAFSYQHVIDENTPGEVTAHMYKHLSYVTEFRFCDTIQLAVTQLPEIRNVYDPTINMLESQYALVFVDNHDNQRGHWSNPPVTYKDGMRYTQAQALALGQDYGWPRIMSSYDFTNDTDQGPPHNADWSTKDVVLNPDGSCADGWVCEHRWTGIAGMVGWARAVTGSTGFDNWWESGNKVAWSRGGRGFIAFSNDGPMSETLQTGLPAGDYCNVIQGCPTHTGCEGDIVTVDDVGNARIELSSDPPILALHVQAISASGSCV